MNHPASIIGAVLGFFIGFGLFRSILLGIILALIGRSIGYRLGGASSSTGRQHGNWGFSGWTSASDAHVFTESLFSMLGKLAAADGHVSVEEEQLFRRIVINELHITSPSSIASAMEKFHSGASSSEPMSYYARQVAETFRNRPQLLEMMLIIMIRVCAVSEGIHPNEDRMLREAANIFGYSSRAYESIRSRYTFGGNKTGGHFGNASNNYSQAYETLGVGPDASNSEIRRAYHKKATEYHPDKIAAKGLPKEFTEFANKKFQEIQNAWEEIRKTRKI